MQKTPSSEINRSMTVYVSAFGRNRTQINGEENVRLLHIWMQKMGVFIVLSILE